MDDLTDKGIALPWGSLRLGEDIGGGKEIWVEATESFQLTLHTDAMSYFEHITPGRHRLLLTHLDRTDIKVDD